MDWYPHHIVDYRRDTLHLTTLEHGAYRLLIDAYMELGKLPDDDTILARFAGMTPTEWASIAKTIRKFFGMPRDGFLRHKRCDAEIAKQAQWRAANAAKQAAWRQRRTALRNSNAKVVDLKGNPHEDA